MNKLRAAVKSSDKYCQLAVRADSNSVQYQSCKDHLGNSGEVELSWVFLCVLWKVKINGALQPILKFEKKFLAELVKISRQLLWIGMFWDRWANEQKSPNTCSINKSLKTLKNQSLRNPGKLGKNRKSRRTPDELGKICETFGKRQQWYKVLGNGFLEDVPL